VHSAIGTRHSRHKLPCQDYGRYIQSGSVLLGAVSDGAGSARYANVGACLAVETALLQMKDQLESQRKSQFEPKTKSQSSSARSGNGALAPFTNSQFTDSQAQALFTQVVTEVVRVLKHKAQIEHWALRDLSCTLLTFIATPSWVAAMQIGDGFMVVSAATETTSPYQLLFSPSKGEYINETCFVTSPSAIEQMQVGIYPHPPQFICAATDGLERVALRLSDWSPFSPFFKPFEDCLRLAPEQASDYLQAFLASERLNARTDDDKTLLLCLYAQEEGQVCPQ
jgi:Protein phosphatase 2C